MKKRLGRTIKYLLLVILLFQACFLVSCLGRKKIKVTVIDGGRITAVNEEGLYGYVDKFGEVKIDFMYTYATPFYNQRAVVKRADSNFYLIDNKNKKLSNEYKSLIYNRNYKVLIGSNGNKSAILLTLEGVEIVPEGKYDQIGSFYDGYSSVSKNGLFGLINTKGEEIIKPKYKYLDLYIMNDLLLAYDGEHYGYINEKDEVIIPFKYSVATTFTSSITNVVYEGKKQVINTKGEVIWEETSEELYNTVIKDFIITTTKNYLIVRNNKGELVLDNLKCDSIKITDEFIITISSEEIVFYTLKGKELDTFTNSTLKIIYDIEDEVFYYVIRTDDKNYFYKERFNRLYQLDIDEDLEVRDTNLFAYGDKLVLFKEGKCGLVSESGKILEDIIYDDIFVTDENYTVYYKDGKCGLKNSFGITYIEDKNYRIISYTDYSLPTSIFYEGWWK